MDELPDDLDALIAGMRGPFLDTSADRVAVIAIEASRLATSADWSSSLTLLIREAHTLKGGGATFGVPSLGEAAGRVEQIGKALLARGLPISSLVPLHQAVAELQAVLAGLRRA
jgi:HPt (histidine-containing phosphotransfer) domain-containing protein